MDVFIAVWITLLYIGILLMIMNCLKPLLSMNNLNVEKINFQKKHVATSTVCSSPPWLLSRPAVDLSLHSSDKGDTAPDIFKSRFCELCSHFRDYYHIYTDGSKVGNKVAAAAVHKHGTKTIRYRKFTDGVF